MNKLRGFNLVLVVSTLIMTLTACGSSDASSEEEKSSESNSEDTIKIGATMPLSGPGAAYGNLMLNGLKLGIDHVNESGGVNGKKVELITMDSKTDAQTALNASKKLIEVDDVVWISTAYTETAFAQQPLADENQVVLMNGGGNGPKLAEITGNYYYNNVPLVSNESEVLVNYLRDETDIQKLAIISNNDESMSLEMEKIFTEQWTSAGGEIVASESNNADATNLKPQLLKIKNANPEALVLLNDGTTTERVVKQAEEVGIDTQLLGFNMHLLPNILSLPAAEGMITTSLAYDPDPEFVESFIEQFNEEPNFYSVNYYDQALILKEAATKALEEYGEVTGETLKKSIEEIRVFDGMNGATEFGDNGISKKDLNIVQVKEGKAEIISSYRTEDQ